MDEAVYGPGHADVGAGLNNLAHVLQDLGRAEAARPLQKRALAIGEAVSGPDHPVVATNLNTLAKILQDLGRAEAARPLLERALAIRRRHRPAAQAHGTGPPGRLNCVVSSVPGRLTAWVRIERFDPIADQQRLRACFQIADACGHHDDPELPHQSFAGFANDWAHGWGNPTQTWLACDEVGEPIGCYLLVLPDRDNPTMASCALFIAPACRRSGHGRRLLAHCADQARLAGRSRLTAQVAQDSPAAAFAVSAGARIGMSEVLRVLTVDDAVRSRLPGLRAEAMQASRGYSLVSWLGATPEEHIHGAAGIELAMADAPRDPGVEPESWDADRIRKVEQLGIAAGQRFYAVAALHDDSGEMVALTQIGTSSGLPGWGFQYLTAVLADHRGHRLGLLVKTANLELVLGHEPGLRSIVTGNAGPNDHMIAINDTLGFRVLSVRRNCELDLTATRPRG